MRAYTHGMHASARAPWWCVHVPCSHRVWLRVVRCGVTWLFVSMRALRAPPIFGAPDCAPPPLIGAARDTCPIAPCLPVPPTGSGARPRAPLAYAPSVPRRSQTCPPSASQQTELVRTNFIRTSYEHPPVRMPDPGSELHPNLPIRTVHGCSAGSRNALHRRDCAQRLRPP